MPNREAKKKTDIQVIYVESDALEKKLFGVWRGEGRELPKEEAQTQQLQWAFSIHSRETQEMVLEK